MHFRIWAGRLARSQEFLYIDKFEPFQSTRFFDASSKAPCAIFGPGDCVSRQRDSCQPPFINLICNRRCLDSGHVESFELASQDRFDHAKLADQELNFATAPPMGVDAGWQSHYVSMYDFLSIRR